MEIGIFLAILASLSWATNDVFNKKSIIEGFNENFILWIRFPISTIITLPAGIYFWDPSLMLFLSTFLWLPLEIVGSIFFIKAIKLSPISEVIPFLSFIPVFSLAGSFIILGEDITKGGLIGIGFIIVGSFIITGGSLKILFIFKKGIMFMLISSICFGLNIPAGKFAIINSNPYFFTWYYCLVMSIGLLPFVSIKEILKTSNYKNKYIIPIGVLFVTGGLLYNMALSLTPSPYVASVERTAIIFSVFYGKIFFGEEIRRSFAGSLLMLVGIVFITFI